MNARWQRRGGNRLQDARPSLCPDLCGHGGGTGGGGASQRPRNGRGRLNLGPENQRLPEFRTVSFRFSLRNPSLPVFFDFAETVD